VHIGRDDDMELARRHGEMMWVGRLHSALELDRFRLYCQEIASTRSTALEVKHYEILLRLLDDEGGLVLPGQFLPSAERYKLENKIDRWVVINALSWLKEYPDLMSLCSINVSGSSLADQEFFDFFVAHHEACFFISPAR
jgi:EAL domain-containing protein (putative c-di-GMP-specific phosphodiesterase class I)